MRQRRFWREESYQYFQRHYAGKDLRRLSASPWLMDVLHQSNIYLDGTSVLDIGCGPGVNLHQIMKHFNCRRGVGLESSPQTVAAVKNVFPELEFVVNDAVCLPFESNTFDLVILRSVLHSIDRDYFVQTLGEAVRVCYRYLLLSDYTAPKPHSTIYEHNAAYRIYKMSYIPLLNATLWMKPIFHQQHWNADDFSQIETVLFEKQAVETCFPLLQEDPAPATS